MFVALWHDISLNLLIWGWLIVLFMMPEIIAGYIFPRRKWENNLTAYRVLCGIGVVGNLMMMMMANLVGFAVGVDGLKSIIYGIFKDFSGTYPRRPPSHLNSTEQLTDIEKASYSWSQPSQRSS